MKVRIAGVALLVAAISASAVAQTNTFPSSGNVGIGLTNPSAALTIANDGPVQLLIQGKTNWQYELFFGYNTSSNYGWIQASENGVANEPLVLNPNNGNVGIGVTNPGASLEVNGGIKLTSGSPGGITFADGSNQTTSAAATPTQAGGAFIAGLVLNNLYVSSCTNTPHAYKIATLVASSAGTYDHLHVFVTLDNDFLSGGNSYIDAVFANRSGFNYSYTVRGSAVSGGARLVAYQTSTGAVDIYIQANGTSTCTNASYSVIENQQETVYPNPVDYGSTIAGTLIFDSSSSSYPPASFINFSNNVGIGTTAPAYNLDVAGVARAQSGIIYPDGNKQTTAWTGVLCGGDYAEAVDAKGSRKSYEPGDVLVIGDGSDGEVQKSTAPYSTMVAGIYATKPGVIGRRQSLLKDAEEIPMAMVGITPTKVTGENGPIHRGDLLVTSSTAGYAMKGTDHNRLVGAVIGKALGALDSGTGVIEVLVTLQ